MNHASKTYEYERMAKSMENMNTLVSKMTGWMMKDSYSIILSNKTKNTWMENKKPRKEIRFLRRSKTVSLQRIRKSQETIQEVEKRHERK